ncbi:hypothetical protein POX_h09849 [Penicillium oxalicum]|uniref:hypothetical protein n=1 Tax=Penicillium oxalicum TaxID=69781 RepID=UPI0020B8D82C|nr:hypothetical protein POX_h09849 [Penicillium oxalicum]KAI2786082.1 hypothetical protein POX_h09849 [Penicillium oxalicum]
MHLSIKIPLLALALQQGVSAADPATTTTTAATTDTSCGPCQHGYVCKQGHCILDTEHLTNPLQIFSTITNPGGPLQTATDSTTAMETTPSGASSSSASAGATQSASSSDSATADHSSSTMSMTSREVPTGSSSTTAAAAGTTTASGGGSTLSAEWSMWMALGLVVVGLGPVIV